MATSTSLISPLQTHYCIFSTCKNSHKTSIKLVPSKLKIVANHSSIAFLQSYNDCKLRRRTSRVSSLSQDQEVQEPPEETKPVLTDEEVDAECVRQILRILDLLKEKRDMTFNEVRLTIMIEDPRDAETKRQLAAAGKAVVTREEMAEVLVDVYEGRMPTNRFILRELAKEMLNWPKLETDVEKTRNPTLSPYAQVTDTGVDPRIATQRARLDWDEAAEVYSDDEKVVDEDAPPPLVGYSILYLVTAIPVIIAVSVVLVLFFNSLK